MCKPISTCVFRAIVKATSLYSNRFISSSDPPWRRRNQDPMGQLLATGHSVAASVVGVLPPPLGHLLRLLLGPVALLPAAATCCNVRMMSHRARTHCHDHKLALRLVAMLSQRQLRVCPSASESLQQLSSCGERGVYQKHF